MYKRILILGLLLISTSAHAGTIALGTISADATPGGFNNNFTTLVNVVNGNLEGSGSTGASLNIKAGSLGVLDMADEVSPRVRDSELLSVTYDTTSVSNSYVVTGLTPATDATLISNISAGTAYINGYRVAKTATSHTYTASMDTYVDLSQTGVYTYSEVAVGASAPSVAPNSARLAKVTTTGTAITVVTDLANRRLPGLIIPAQYRVGMFVSKDSATTLTVQPGSVEVNSALVNKTALTTLTLGTAGSWAGGSALTAANTFGYVGIDSLGNIKMHTTAPTHDNYGVSTTSGKKRYATWSSTVYRILGWFRMNGSSQVDTVGNIKESDVANAVISSDSTSTTTTSTTSVQMNGMTIPFYSSGGPVEIDFQGAVTSSVDGEFIQGAISVDSGVIGPVSSAVTAASSSYPQNLTLHWLQTYSQGTHTFNITWRTGSGTAGQGTAIANIGTSGPRLIMVTEK